MNGICKISQKWKRFCQSETNEYENKTSRNNAPTTHTMHRPVDARANNNPRINNRKQYAMRERKKRTEHIAVAFIHKRNETKLVNLFENAKGVFLEFHKSVRKKGDGFGSRNVHNIFVTQSMDITFSVFRLENMGPQRKRHFNMRKIIKSTFPPNVFH